jgi:beta-galactosidase
MVKMMSRFMMLRRWPAIVLALHLTATVVASTATADDLRQRTVIDRDWRFTLGDPASAAAADFDEHSWQSVDLPHSFSEPYFLSSDFYQGVGWYRKHLQLPTAIAGKRVFIEFDGAFRAAEVSVNGRQVGKHHGGYTGFSIDITDAIKPGGDNVLAVRLDNRWNARITPRAGDHTFSGGIYRDVWLVIADPLHVTWYGTFVKSTDATAASAKISVDTEVKNDSTSAKQISIESVVMDPNGSTVATLRSTPQSIPQGQTVTVSQTTDAIAGPRLWSPQSPIMYQLRTTVFDGDRAADSYVTPFGIRSIKFTANQGFFLNGKHYYFKGANVHQDHAGWGDAVTQAGAARDVGMIKDAGFDFIRGSHYPHSPAFAAACDRIGVLFWSENDFWGSGGSGGEGRYDKSGAYPRTPADQQSFEQTVLDDLRDMIRVHRNHPSIIVWSTGNEDFFTAPSTLPKVRELLSKEVALAHQLDPTRPVGIGGCQRGDLDKLGDVAGYNGDGARLFIDPGIPSVVTEYGSTTADRPGKYEPGWGDLPTGKDQDKSQPYPWRYSWRSGEVIWCGFDHGTQFGPKLGDMGIIDYFRIPKRAWYWYRNAYLDIPPPAWPTDGTPATLVLTSDKISIAHADGTDDVHVLVTVEDANGHAISNNPPVDLSIVSGPGDFPTGPTIHFDKKSDISIRDGHCAIEFRSYYAGTTVIRATSPGLSPGEIIIKSAGGPSFVDGITPPVPPRPYVRFTSSDAARVAARDTSFGRDNPTSASSEAPGHAGNLANDGDLTTYWQSAHDDKQPAWTLDMERVAAISSVLITFPEAGKHHFKIDLSDDGTAWHPAADLTGDDTADAHLEVHLAAESKGRFIRVSFTGAKASISEFEARGTLVGP